MDMVKHVQFWVSKIILNKSYENLFPHIVKRSHFSMLCCRWFSAWAAWPCRTRYSWWPTWAASSRASAGSRGARPTGASSSTPTWRWARTARCWPPTANTTCTSRAPSTRLRGQTTRSLTPLLLAGLACSLASIYSSMSLQWASSDSTIWSKLFIQLPGWTSSRFCLL